MFRILCAFQRANLIAKSSERGRSTSLVLYINLQVEPPLKAKVNAISIILKPQKSFQSSNAEHFINQALSPWREANHCFLHLCCMLVQLSKTLCTAFYHIQNTHFPPTIEVNALSGEVAVFTGQGAPCIPHSYQDDCCLCLPNKQAQGVES